MDMQSEQRQDYILENAQKNGFISISKTAKQLDVSVETIRRDINVLCGKKLLKKVHGGAAPIKLPLLRSSNFLLRIQDNQQGKMTIGAEAAGMIQHGNVVAMDDGATAYTLAICISGIRDVTFIVNSLPIATILLDKLASGDFSGEVILVGGKLDVKSHSANDLASVETLDKYHFDIAFISCTSLSTDGVANSDIPESIYAEHLMRRSAVSVLIVDSEKLGKSSIYTFAKPTDFDRIIIDDKKPCPADLKEILSNSSTELTIVSCD